jgi:hypothetical protein
MSPAESVSWATICSNDLKNSRLPSRETALNSGSEKSMPSSAGPVLTKVICPPTFSKMSKLP